MDRIVDYLSSYATTLKFEDLPAEVVLQAKRMILDTVGCAIGGFSSQPAKIARDLAGTVSSSRPATIMGSGQSTSPDMAAFANGVAIRYLDFNDGYTGREPGHPSDTIAAILSPAEVAHADGKTVITATVLAYETFCRLCDAASIRSRGFDHVTLGIVAAGLGASKAMGFSREQTAQTLNLCIVPNLAMFQTRIGEVSMWKGCAFANASRNAIFAALLAQRGLSGPSPIFEGDGGYFRTVSGGPFELEPFGGNGNPFKIMEATVKRFPFGLYSQTVVEAALEVRDRLDGVENIKEINVHTLNTAVNIMAGDEEKWRPANRETADHSMPYLTAVALKYGTVETQHFGEEYLRNSQLLELVQKVKVSISEEANRRAPDAMLASVEVVTTSGDRFASPEIPYHRGHWKNPMTGPELEGKFRSLSKDQLAPTQTEALLEQLWTLEQLDDIGQLIGMVKLE